MIAIWKREIQSYFSTPVGYVFMGVFLALSGVVFYIQNISALSSDVLYLLSQNTFLWLLLSPVLTMRLMAEERHQKTDQLLLTSPISLWGIVAGKYFAAAAVLFATVFLTLGYVLVISIFGKVYLGELIVGYLGFILQGCSFLALDLYISGCARSQVTAAIAAFGINLALWLLDLLATAVTLPVITPVLHFLSLYDRYQPFLLGQLSFASILYYASFSAVFLFMTVRMLDARRWREG
jgi:ABC-2 type transport system permease protein